MMMLGSTVALLAHDPGLSALDVKLDAREIVAVLSVAAADAAIAGGPKAMPGVARDSIVLSLDGRALAASTTSFWSDDSGGIHVRLVYERPPGSRLSIRSTIPMRLARGHRELLSARLGDSALLVERMLDAESGDVIIDVSAASPAVGSLDRSLLFARRPPHPHRLRPSVVPRRRVGRPAPVAGRDSDDHRIHGRPLTHAAARRHRTPRRPRTASSNR